jgi:puromycin-sensitive aminopeptidase
MEWWTHLWLNEGFASYIPYLAIDELFPEWGIWDQFATDDLAIALRLDALRHTHPIEVDVHDPNEIGEIFDAVSYSKGATVIRMLAEYIGDKDFKDGLSYYLKKHSYSNASTIHLWDAFEKVSKKPVKKMMAVWTGKSGYPFLTAQIKDTKLSLSQKRFFGSATSSKKTKDTTVWPVPISVVTPKGEQVISLMTSKRTTISLPKAPWFKLNAHEGSLYRVCYSKEILEQLQGPISMGRLSSADRLGVVRDLFSLSEAGHYETTLALEYAQIYKSESEYTVWLEIISGLRHVSNLLYGSKSYDGFREYAKGILSDISKKVGWETRTNESHNDSLMRSLVLGASSSFGDERVVAQALKIFSNRKNEPIHADLRGVVYATVARTGSEKEYEEILNMYRSETLHEEKNRLLGALGVFSDKKLLARTLEFTMTEEVRMQDRNGAFASVLVNPNGRELGWKFLKKNWKKIGEAYGDGNHLLSRLIGVLNRNTTRGAYNDIKIFFKTHSAPSATRTIDQTLEQIDSNVVWLARDGKNIEKWLSSR